MKLEDLQVYTLSMQLGNKIWDLVSGWNYFDKSTMGGQMVRSVDSIAANIAEGFGRFHYGESKHFSYYSRGSLFETKTWVTKARARKLINEEDFSSLVSEIEILGIKLNNYINSIGPKKAK